MKADHASGGSVSSTDGFTESRTPTNPSAVATSTQLSPPDFVLLRQTTHGLSKSVTRPPPRRAAGPAQTSAPQMIAESLASLRDRTRRRCKPNRPSRGSIDSISLQYRPNQMIKPGTLLDINRYRHLGRFTRHAIASAASRSFLTESAGLSDFSMMRWKVFR